MTITKILLVIAVSAVAHAATVRYDGKGTDSKKSQGQSDFPVTKSSILETTSRSAKEDIHLAQLKMQSNQMENSRVPNNNKFAYQSENLNSQAFQSQDHFATDSPVAREYQRDQSLFHSQQPDVSVTTVSAPLSPQNERFNDEYAFQPEGFTDQPTAPNQFYNMEQQQFYDDQERNSGDQQFFNNRQQNLGQEQFYNDKQSQDQQFFNYRQQNPGQEQFYNSKQSQDQQFFNNKQQSPDQQQFYNTKQSQDQQFFNNKQSQDQQFFNNKQSQDQQFFNNKQQSPDQEHFYIKNRQQEQQFFNGKQAEANQKQFYGDKQQSQEQQQFYNDMHVVGVEGQRFNSNSKPFQSISKQQSTQIRTIPVSTQIKTQGIVQMSAFDNREHPIVLPRGAVQSSTVLVSGLKNLPLLPAMVYNAGQVPSTHAVAFSSDPLYKGAAVRHQMQTPYVRYVYSHIL